MNKRIKHKKQIKMWIKSELKKLRKEHQKGSCGIHKVEYNLRTGEAQYYVWHCGTSNTDWIKKHKKRLIRKITWVETE